MEVESSVTVIDWSLCVICQKKTDQDLVCPADSKRNDVGAGYFTAERDFIGFSEYSALPHSMKLCHINNGSGIQSTLYQNRACWHKSCRDKYNSTKLKRLRERLDFNLVNESVPKRTRLSQGVSTERFSQDFCFFCDQPANSDELRQVQTFSLEAQVRSAALLLNDTQLLAKLSSCCDMIALEAKYHVKCLVSIYNRVRSHSAKHALQDDVDHSILTSIAFSELVAYIQECRLEMIENSSVPSFKLADIANLYRDKLIQLGVEVRDRVHSTRLKEKLLAHIPGLVAHKKGCEVILIFDKDIGLAIPDHNHDTKALCLAQAAKIIRDDMFGDNEQFQGFFTKNCEKNSVPITLVSLVRMILEGSIISEHEERNSSQVAISISQLIKFNTKKRTRKMSSTMHHTSHQETPLPIYVGLLIHNATRSRTIVDKLFQLGISISYDCVLRLSADLANSVCKYYNEKKVVCPPHLKGQLFTTAAVDNIDYNPSSTTANGSFHGTGISLFQHPSHEMHGTTLSGIKIMRNSSKTIDLLPEFYTSIEPVSLLKSDVRLPAAVNQVKMSECFTEAKSEEFDWLESASKACLSDSSEVMSWAAYHSQHGKTQAKQKCSSTLLPLFEDAAHSPAMIRHAMTMVKAAVEHLNPGQTPVLVCDQPLFAIAKEIQWTWPDTFGENSFVLMLGGLHIEMTGLKTLGSWLDGSGWTEALAQASITTAGTAESYIRCSHVTRTRYAHQVTAVTLHMLQKEAYEAYTNSITPAEQMDFQAWSIEKSKNCPQFQYWSHTLELEMNVLLFVRSIRESNFFLYIESLKKLVPWFFALDHTHYARWGSIHIRDMLELAAKQPSVHEEFVNGNFTVQKTLHSFSSMALDQAHEQNNEMVKGNGGAIGLMQNPQALCRWMVGEPQIAQLVHEFEECRGDSIHSCKENERLHHEQSKAFQLRFKNHVEALYEFHKRMWESI